MSVKVGFDAKRLFNNSTGLGNYSRDVLRNLKRYAPNLDCQLFTTKINADLDTSFFEKEFDVVLPDTKFKSYWRTYKIAKEAKERKLDIFHGLSNEIPRNLSGLKSVVTIHDLIFKKLPQTYPRIDRQIYDWKVKHACHHADKIIAISEQSKQDILNYYDVDENRVEVIYQSVHPVFYQRFRLNVKSFREQFNLPQEYMLSVGALSERKNVLGVLGAMSQLSEVDRIPLVIVGKGDSYKKKMLAFIEEKQLSKWVIFIDDYLSVEELKVFYELASLVVYPSFYEGFGLPIVEALLSRTPVISSNISSMPEAGGKYTKYINPDDTAELSAAIKEILSDTELQNEMIQNGYIYANQNFSPEKLTRQLYQLYQSL